MGRKKEVFDAELYALYRATKILEERREEGQDYTIWTDSSAALNRAALVVMCQGQRFSVALIEVHNWLASRGNILALRCIPGHTGVGGNEVADEWAGESAESVGDTFPRAYLRETSIADLARAANEARSTGMSRWIVDRVNGRRRH